MFLLPIKIGSETKASHMLDKSSSTEVHFWLLFIISFIFILITKFHQQLPLIPFCTLDKS